MPSARVRAAICSIWNTPSVPRVVKMDIDIHAALLRNTEHDVELPLRHRGRCSPGSMPPTRSAAPRDRGIEQFRAFPDSLSTPFCGKATSWMSMKSRYSSRTAKNALQRRQADLPLDIDVAAHLRRAVSDAELQLASGANIHRRRGRDVLASGTSPARARRNHWCRVCAASRRRHRSWCRDGCAPRQSREPQARRQVDGRRRMAPARHRALSP